MKIGMVVHNLDVSGGYQKLVLRLAQHLSKLGHEVVVYTLSADRRKCYPELIKLINVKSLYKKATIDKEVSVVNEFQKLARLVDPTLDALIIHSLISLHILNSYKPQKETFKSVWMANNQIPSDLDRGFTPLLLNFLKSVPRDIRAIRHSFPALVFQLTEVYSLRHALLKLDFVATYDRFNKGLAERVVGKRAVVVYAGADLSEFESLRKFRNPVNDDRFQVLSVGSLYPHRRYEDLIEAIYLLKQEGLAVEAKIVGLRQFSPEYSRFLRNKVGKLKLEDKVTFIEYVPDKKLRELYRQSDVFVFINDGYTWGISVFEAVAAGLPVIITNNIGAVDIIKDGKYGWVVPPRDPKAVARAIKEVLTDQDRVADITEASSERVRKLVSWDAYVLRMLELVQL